MSTVDGPMRYGARIPSFVGVAARPAGSRSTSRRPSGRRAARAPRGAASTLTQAIGALPRRPTPVRDPRAALDWQVEAAHIRTKRRETSMRTTGWAGPGRSAA
ncbi:hypothetical protein GCM10010123_12430 [Pilimelia anulata]|uniref:Uncharacterized protein n=1 Tax=Pilimelia anulata TaxID=53371 RepID=A0A8J3B0N0_9ACTN|nr:hypothetical protein GCM10010123_12430 [Pilimelia anulata]